MNPLAQTFNTTEPNSSIDVILLTSINLYFRSKSSTGNIEVHLRTTEGGIPTQYILPYSSVTLNPGQVNISSDASVGTMINFPRPIALQTNTLYAIMINPLVGDDSYQIWTGVLGKADVNSGNIIDVNNPLGTLYSPSNDSVFTPLPNEYLKYELYRANMSALNGQAVFTNANTDFFYYKGLNGAFIDGESVVIANSNIKLASLVITGSNTFSTGTIVYQSNGSANLAFGNVAFCNTSLMLLTSVNGAFTNTYTIAGIGNSNIIPAPTSVNQTIAVSNTSNTITVPFANSSLVSDFAVNNYIYIQTNNMVSTSVYKITAVNSSANTISITSNAAFSDGNASIGRIKGDGYLSGILATRAPKLAGQPSVLALSNVTCNSSMNFANSNGQMLIGLNSGASVISIQTVDLPYESITPNFVSISPSYATLDWLFKGTSNTKSVDSSYQSVQVQNINELIDENRIIMSVSNELQNPAGAVGNKTVFVEANLLSTDAKTTPYIDISLSNTSTFTHNIVENKNNLYGYTLQLNNYDGNVKIGDVLWQNNGLSNTSAIVISIYNGAVKVSNTISANASVIPYFVANGSATVTGTGGTYLVNSAIPFNESVLPDLSTSSRYISKTVVLNTGQDAEDLVSYITAYRPVGTDFRVYAKVQSDSDNSSFASRPWGIMPESTTTTGLNSSLVNKNDYVELNYSFPQSVPVFSSFANCTANTTTLNMPPGSTNQSFNPGDFVYIHDNITNAFNVRRIKYITSGNTTSVSLVSNVSITTANASIGVIPGLRNQYAPFKYDGNSNIVRYSSTNDNVYDSFINFAMKVVFLSNNSAIVPRMTDIRCIALQV